MPMGEATHGSYINRPVSSHSLPAIRETTEEILFFGRSRFDGHLHYISLCSTQQSSLYHPDGYSTMTVNSPAENGKEMLIKMN